MRLDVVLWSTLAFRIGQAKVELRQGVPLLVELIFYLALLLVAGLAFIMLVGIGVLDTWFDWRRLRPAAPEDQNEA